MPCTGSRRQRQHNRVYVATLNVHLKILQAAGILASRRDGRHVLYSRTPLGASLAGGGRG